MVLERYDGACKQESGFRPRPTHFGGLVKDLESPRTECSLDNEGMYFLSWVLVTYILSLSQPEHESIWKSKARTLLVLCCPYSGLLSFLMKSHWKIAKGVKGLNDMNEISIPAPTISIPLLMMNVLPYFTKSSTLELFGHTVHWNRSCPSISQSVLLSVRHKSSHTSSHRFS